MTTKKSIAFVANTSWSIYKFRLSLIERLIDNGYSIYVLTPRDSYTARFSDLPGLTYVELTKFKGKRLSPLYDLALYRELKGHYRRLKPDLIFHYTIKANLFGSLAASRCRHPLHQRDHRDWATPLRAKAGYRQLLRSYTNKP